MNKKARRLSTDETLRSSGGFKLFIRVGSFFQHAEPVLADQILILFMAAFTLRVT